MKRAFLHLIYIICTFVCLAAVAACHDKADDPTPLPQPQQPGRPGETFESTLIVYMAGENTLARFTDADSLEIAQGLALIPDSARVVVFIDDARSSRICVGTNDTPLQTVRTFPRDINAADSAEMLGVLGEIFETYPARHYGLGFWSHASGWVVHGGGASNAPRRSFGIDNGRRDAYSNEGLEMDITTLANVLRRLPHTDYILFDACFMQCVEVAYELRDVTDYVIASPAEIPGDGAPYQHILAPLCQSPADVVGAVRAYYDFYESGEGHPVYYGVELTALRTDRLEALAAATRPLVLELFGGRREADVDGVQRYCTRDGSDYYTEYYDISHLFYTLLPEATYATWRAVFDDAVAVACLSEAWYTALQSPHRLTVDDPEHTGGVSMFTPAACFDDDRQWNTYYHTTAWYRDAGFAATGW